MFCPKCGTANMDDASFCANCGAALKRDSASGNVAPGMGNAVNAAGAAAATASRKPWLKIAIPIVIIIVATAIIFFALNSCGGSGVTHKASVNDYTWDELSKISDEISRASSEDAAVDVAKKYDLTNSSGQLDGTQVKNVQLSNGQNAQVQIVGFRHDDKASGGKAGITFIFKDAIAMHPMNSSDTNVGGWERSQMRSWLATDGMNMLPSELSGKIVEVKKMSNNVGETKNAASVTSTTDKLWLFSATELCGTINWYGDVVYNNVQNAEGTEYKLFRDQSVSSTSDNTILTKSYNGSTCYWWMRSADPRYSTRFGDVYSGDPSAGYGASYSYAVVPGFCI